MNNHTGKAITDLAEGKLIIIADDEHRENEGDLVMDARFASPERIAFMARHACGLICVPMRAERLAALGLKPMAETNTDSHGTAFTVSVDHRGCTTGISAAERASTIRALADTSSTALDFRIPGHVFPLAGRTGGLAERQGHTEASLEMVQAARADNSSPAAVICEILNPDGSMTRGEDLKRFARAHELSLITVREITEYLHTRTLTLTREAHTRLPLADAVFDCYGYRNAQTGEEHLALVLGPVAERQPVVCRVHSECLTGDALGSLRCDCGDQYKKAIRMIAKEGCGILIYLRQEGRGIGLINKLKAYGLQDAGCDTVDANLNLGFQADERTYDCAAEILRDHGISSVQLVTNNPDKCNSLAENGIEVSKRIPLEITANAHNKAYLDTKKTRMNHILSLQNN